MAKLECSLLSIYAKRSELSQIVSRLQEMSVMDIETAAGDEETALAPEGYFREKTEKAAAEYEKKATLAETALKLLDERAPEKKKLTEMFSGPRVIERKEFYIDEAAQQICASYIDEIIGANRSIAELKAELVRLKTNIDMISVWKPLDVPLGFEGTNATACFIGTIAGNYNLEQLLSLFAESVPKAAVYGEIIATERDNTYIFLCVNKVFKEKALEVLRTLAFARPTGFTDSVPAQMICELEQKLLECEEQLRKTEQSFLELSKNRRSIEHYADYCRGVAEKNEVLGDVLLTEHTVLIKGYVATVDLPLVKQELEKDFTVIVESEAANEELAPVKLKNNAFSSPAEIITQMYSLPSHKDIDPTPLTGFFYYLLFGMMLSDAGYGLLMVIGTLLVIFKFNPSPSWKKSMQMFLYCGISTVFWGLLFGSFFGDSIPAISRTFFGKEVSLPALIDPMNGGAVTLLILSIAIGFVQIIAGLSAKFVTCIKNKDMAGAFFDAGLWITTLLGIGLLAVGMFAVPVLKTVGMVVAIASVVGLILTQGREKKNPIMRLFSGVASLYDITGYVSDLLSFSRLMALGLTTAAMGAVFNLLGTMGGKSVAGVIMMLIIFPVGHGVSFALNALGAYVHTLRLQYVELFSKFYDGGGREFKAFSIKNKYVGIKNDTVAEQNSPTKYKEEN